MVDQIAGAATPEWRNHAHCLPTESQKMAEGFLEVIVEPTNLSQLVEAVSSFLSSLADIPLVGAVTLEAYSGGDMVIVKPTIYMDLVNAQNTPEKLLTFSKANQVMQLLKEAIERVNLSLGLEPWFQGGSLDGLMVRLDEFFLALSSNDQSILDPGGLSQSGEPSFLVSVGLIGQPTEPS